MIRFLLFNTGRLIFRFKKWGAYCEGVYHSQRYHKLLQRCGIGVVFNGVSQLYGLDKVRIASNVHIGENAYINGVGGLEIGENTHISRNLVLYTLSHEFEGERLPYDEQLRLKAVRIGKNVWIGTNVTILPGTDIGDGAIIGAGAVVCGMIEPMAIYGASKAAKIGERNKDRYARLEKEERYGGISGRSLD